MSDSESYSYQLCRCLTPDSSVHQHLSYSAGYFLALSVLLLKVGYNCVRNNVTTLFFR